MNESGRAKPVHIAMAGALYALFGLFLIWPIVNVIKAGFVAKSGGVTFKYLELIFQDPVLIRGLWNAVIVAVTVTSATLLISLPLAVLSVRYDFPGKRLLSGLLMVPLVLPPFVGAMGVRLILSRYGPLTQILGAGERGIDWLGKYRFAGVVIVEMLGLFPIMVLNLQAALANVDPAMEQAAANLGAGWWERLWRVTLPLMRPGIFAGCTLVLIWSFTELGVPLMFEYYTITPVQVFAQITDVAASPLPFALVVLMLLASGALYLVGKVLLGRGFSAATAKGLIQAEQKKLIGWKAGGAIALFVVVIGAAVMPHVAIVLTSICRTGQWYRSMLPRAFTGMHFIDGLRDELAFPSIRHSLMYASMAMAIAMVVGLMTAIVVVRSRVRGKWMLDSLAMLPLAVPGLVLAFGYLSMGLWVKQRMGSRTPWFLDLQEWPVGVLVVAYAVRRLPYVVRAAAAGLEQTPVDLEMAGANLGASRGTVLARITMPLVMGNLVAGALLAFSYSMLEVSDSLVLAQRMEYYPITKAIWELSQRLGDGIYIASAVGVWAMVLLTVTMLGAASLMGKKMGSMFRI